MRTGTDYHENGPNSPHAELNSLRSGWDRFWLERPMASEPGAVWQYDSGGVVALSSMLRRRSGMHADAYAEAFLFGPLEIDDVGWSTNAEGHPHTGGGLFLTSKDALKLGQLYLQKGRWGEAQLIPEGWVDASLRRHHTFASPRGSAGKIEGYGYLWWVLSPDPGGSGSADIYAALGYRGQTVFVIPEHELVVVATGWIEPTAPQGPIDFLYGDILPAVVR
jgi:CubicO group peptidase (beta-lactamase class C family)